MNAISRKMLTVQKWRGKQPENHVKRTSKYWGAIKHLGENRQMPKKGLGDLAQEKRVAKFMREGNYEYETSKFESQAFTLSSLAVLRETAM